MDESKVEEEDYNLDLIAYEGGQHLVSYSSKQESPKRLNSFREVKPNDPVGIKSCELHDFSWGGVMNQDPICRDFL